MKRFCIVCIDVGKYNNIMRFFSILLQYKEIIGTLLGTTLGWMLNSFSRHGKLIIYAVWEDKFQKNNNYGSMEDSSIDEAQYYHYELCLDLYNSSGESLIMRKTEVVFLNKENKILFRDIPYDDSTKRYIGAVHSYKKVQPITIPAKTIITLKLHGGIWDSEEQFKKLLETARIMIFYRNEKDKEKKQLITEFNLKKYFDKSDETSFS